MQAVAVIVDGDQRLERGADIIEIDFLGMQRPPRRLYMVFEFLGPLIGAIPVAHGHCPDTPRHPAHHRVFRTHAVAEKEGKVAGKIIYFHAPREIGLDNR